MPIQGLVVNIIARATFIFMAGWVPLFGSHACELSSFPFFKVSGIRLGMDEEEFVRLLPGTNQYEGRYAKVHVVETEEEVYKFQFREGKLGCVLMFWPSSPHLTPRTISEDEKRKKVPELIDQLAKRATGCQSSCQWVG